MSLVTKYEQKKVKVIHHFRCSLGPNTSSTNEPHNSPITPFSLLARPDPKLKLLCRWSISPKRDRPTVSVRENGSMSTESLSTTSDKGLAATSEVDPATVKTWGFIG